MRITGPASGVPGAEEFGLVFQIRLPNVAHGQEMSRAAWEAQKFTNAARKSGEKHPSKILESTTIFKAMVGKKIKESAPATCHKFSSGSSCATRLKQKLGKFSCSMSSVQCPVPHSVVERSVPFNDFDVFFFVVIGDLLARHHHRLRPKGGKKMMMQVFTGILWWTPAVFFSRGEPDLCYGGEREKRTGKSLG